MVNGHTTEYLTGKKLPTHTILWINTKPLYWLNEARTKEEHILHHSIIWNSLKCKLTCSALKQLSGFPRDGLEWVVTAKKQRRSFGSDKSALYPDNGGSFTSICIRKTSMNCIP